MKTQEKKRRFLKALEARIGIISTACKDAGISRAAYYKWIEEDESFRKEVEDIQASQIDYVESKLIDRITDNDTTAIIYYLKAKGKKRGWNENYDRVSESESEEDESFRVRAISPIELMERQEAKRRAEESMRKIVITDTMALNMALNRPKDTSGNKVRIGLREIDSAEDLIRQLKEGLEEGKKSYRWLLSTPSTIDREAVERGWITEKEYEDHRKKYGR